MLRRVTDPNSALDAVNFAAGMAKLGRGFSSSHHISPEVGDIIILLLHGGLNDGELSTPVVRVPLTALTCSDIIPVELLPFRISSSEMQVGVVLSEALSCPLFSD